ncbi:uncharacterized protein LOC120427855 [Culex pipiens pallens]|uniref:uncharacterized protein LOC120427855 n=1 Tax=Culex pipiens pallens TaxID=42434 RepID=UPI001954497B|nr:uncharacterized protein LOC120427855 [Culex pipiens pallens]
MNAVLRSGKLNVCHGNAQSLCARKFAKLDELKDLLHSSKISVACFTESWLSPKTSDRRLAIPGFSLIRNDRKFQRGGGIVVYCKHHIGRTEVFRTELTAESADKTECVAVELRVDGEKILLVVVYNPPRNDCSEFLAAKLSEFGTRYENVLLVGDLNTDLAVPSTLRDRFTEVLQTHALFSVGVEPTFYHNRGCSQLDLFITSCAEKVLCFNQVGFPAMSQHDLIFGSLDFDDNPAPMITTYRDYVNFDAATVENAILAIPWSDFFASNEPDLLVNFFNEQAKQVHDACIPLRTKRGSKVSNAWFTNEVRTSMLERDLAYGDWRRAPRAFKDEARRRYNTLRNRTNAIVAAAKAQFLNRHLDNRTPSKILWNRLKSIGVGKERTSPTCDFHPDAVNQTFLSSYIAGEPVRRRTGPDNPYSFAFRPVQQWEVVNAVWDISSNATGLDGLPIAFVKIILPLTIQQVTHIFNSIIETSTFPVCWKHAKILPLRKKPHLNALTNLRPISILCALSKAFEKLMERQMSTFIAENNLLTDHQAGFRKGQSIQTAAVRVYDELAKTVDNRGSAVLLLLDFSKAFDTIPHRKLCAKLEVQFNFSVSAVNLVKSYLENRTQTVFCGDQQSETGVATSGVPQGSVWGPLLFCCHVNDLPTALKFCSIQMYADDVQLYIGRPGPCSREIIRMMNEDLASIVEWSRRNQLCAAGAPVGTRLKLFKSLILPHFLFGEILHVNPSASAMDRLRISLNCCVRFVYGLNRYDHVSHLQANLLGCPLDHLYAHRSCIFLHKLINTHSPPALFQKLIPFRGRRLANLIIPRNNTATYASSLFVRGVVNWNMLPTEEEENSFATGAIVRQNETESDRRCARLEKPPTTIDWRRGQSASRTNEVRCLW